MPLTPEQRAEIRQRIQEPFLRPSRSINSQGTNTPPDYDENDFEPDDRIVDRFDPAPVPAAQRPARRAVGSMRHNSRRANAVWCVELKRKFDSKTDAGRFFFRKASAIADAINRGGLCASYHWENYDEAKHGKIAGNKCESREKAVA